MNKLLIEHEVDCEKFKITGDIDNIREKIEKDKVDFCEYDCCVKLYSDDQLSQEEYINNLDAVLIALYNSIDSEYLKGVIEKFPKKKNGTFKKNQVFIIHTCGNSHYLEDSYGWGVDVLRFKCIGDTELSMQYFGTVMHR